MGIIRDENLFQIEQEVLKDAIKDISNHHHFGDKLMPRYQSLITNYQKLLRVTRKIIRISDLQGQALQHQQIEMQNLLNHANQGFLTFGSTLKVNQKYSAECTRIFNRKISGALVVELFEKEDAAAQDSLRSILERVFLSPKEMAELELQQFPTIVHLNKKEIRVECKLIFSPDKTVDSTVVMMILTDITEQIKAQEKINFLSYHDKLTSLHNRAHIEDVLPALDKIECMPLSIIMADMNGLKLANDVFGHRQGDLLLVAMADVLKHSCRQTDVVARWGGDEFIVLLPWTDQEKCLKVCKRIQNACAAVDHCAIPLSAAVGMATKDSGNISLMELLSIAENRMYSDKLQKRKIVRKINIADLQARLISRCYEDAGHRERVYHMGIEFAEILGGFTESELELLSKLAQFHDIGKVAMPEDILGSDRSLTLSEWDIIKSHSEIGYRMAQAIGEQPVAELILSLHERWDGTGYPCGLKEEQIPFLARFFSIIDIYDVVTHERPYGKALAPKAALIEIEKGKGTQFDPKLAQCFLDYMSKKLQ